MFTDHEVFQVHCQYCFAKAEAKSREEAIKIIEKHEAECKANPKLKKL